MTAPTDSFASIVAELRDLQFLENSHDMQALASRIERLDAEMQTYVRIIEQDKSDLRARLAACEKDAERYRGMRREATRHHLSGVGSDICVTFNIGHDWMQHYDEDAFDAGVDTVLTTRASVPKDAATCDEGKGGVG